MNNEKDFLEYLSDKDKKTNFIIVPFKDIYFEKFNQIRVNSKSYPLSSCAYLSINNQSKVKGQGVHDLSQELMRQIYNQTFSSERLKNKLAKIVLIENNVKSIMAGSEDGRGYKYTDFTEIINTFKSYCLNNEINCFFEYGIDDDYYCIARYMLEDLVYNNCKIGIDLTTSISGYSSIKMTPILIRNDSEIHLTEDELSYENKGNPLTRINENIYKLFDRIDYYVNNVDLLMETEISENILNNIMNSIGLGINEKKYISRNFNGTTLNDFLNYMIGLDFKNNKCDDKEDLLGKILYLLMKNK